MVKLFTEKIDTFIKKKDTPQYSSYLYNDIEHTDTSLDNMIKIDNFDNQYILNTPEDDIKYNCNKIINNNATDFINDTFFNDESKESIFRFQYLINNSFNDMTHQLIHEINTFINNLSGPKKKLLKETDIIFLYKGGTTLKILYDEYVHKYKNQTNTAFFESFAINFKRSDSDYVIMINPTISIEKNGISFAYVYKKVNKRITDILYNISLYLYNDGITDNDILLKSTLTPDKLQQFIINIENNISDLKKNHAYNVCDNYVNSHKIVGIGYTNNKKSTVYYTRDEDGEIFINHPGNTEIMDDNIENDLKSNFVIITKNNNDVLISNPIKEFKDKLDISGSDINFSINDSIDNFCLQRIKLNFVIYYVKYVDKDYLIENFTCPGELIDIVILKQSSYNLESFYKNLENEYTQYIYKLYDKQITYNSYTLYGHIHDLIYILFIVAKFPWEDIKYSKRTDRLILLLIFEAINKNNNIDELKEVIKDYTDLFNQLLFNQLSVNSIDKINDSIKLTRNIGKKNKYFMINLNNFYKNYKKYMEQHPTDTTYSVKLILLLKQFIDRFSEFIPGNIYNIETLGELLSRVNLDGILTKQLGGYRKKYLKYKQKYINLKNKKN